MTPCVPLGCVAGEGDAHRARARDLLLARMSSHESVQCSGEFPALHGPVAENESRPVPSVFVDLTVSSHAAGASQHQQDVVSQRAPSQPPRDCVDPVARSERTEAYRVAAACHEAAKAIESVAKALQGAVKVDQPESKANQEATKVKDLDSQALRASVAAVGRGDSSRARKLKSQLGGREARGFETARTDDVNPRSVLLQAVTAEARAAFQLDHPYSRVAVGGTMVESIPSAEANRSARS
jgi:hypothetical protein